MPSPMPNKANLKSKPHDHRLSRPSGAAEPAGGDPRAGRAVDELEIVREITHPIRHQLIARRELAPYIPREG